MCLPLREAIKSKTDEFRNTFNYTSGEGHVLYLLGEIRDLISPNLTSRLFEKCRRCYCAEDTSSVLSIRISNG